MPLYVINKMDLKFTILNNDKFNGIKSSFWLYQMKNDILIFAIHMYVSKLILLGVFNCHACL